jgi:hypothetical protein
MILDGVPGTNVTTLFALFARPSTHVGPRCRLEVWLARNSAQIDAKSGGFWPENAVVYAGMDND